MKRVLLSLAILIGATAAAEAQIVIQYTKKNKNSSFTFTYGGGSYSCGGYGGWGYGGYAPYGYGVSGGYTVAPGFVYSSGGTTLTFGTNFLGQNWTGYPYGWGAYGTTYYGYPGGGVVWTTGLPGYVDIVPVTRRVTGVLGAPKEFEQLASMKDVAAGVARMKTGDFTGALAEFRQAVVADTSHAAAQLWMAMALTATGDAANADKAVRSALSGGGMAIESVDLAGALLDPKVRARFVASASSTGGLGAALAFERLGEKEKARAALADVKDDAAAGVIGARLK